MNERSGDEYFACKRKITYATRAEARLDLKSMQRSGKGSGRINVYQCRFCGYFHIGHKPKKRSRSRDRALQQRQN